MKQISVIAESHPNLIADLIETIGASGVNLETLDSETVEGTVIARLTVDQYDRAFQALARAGFNAVSEDAILVRLADRPGALAEIAHRFKEANVPLRSVRIIRRADGYGFVALSTPRSIEALALIQDVLMG